MIKEMRFQSSRYQIKHTTKYTYAAAVPVSQNLIHLKPRDLPHQVCHEFELKVAPRPLQLAHRKDYFGNPVSYFSIGKSHRGLTVTAHSEVEVKRRTQIDPADTLPWESIAASLINESSRDWIDASQFVSESPQIPGLEPLQSYAAESFIPRRSILEGALDLTRRIHADFRYDNRATSVNTPLEEVFENRHGVCQDFAHLQIACLRAVGLAARYVSGYLRTIPPPGKPRLVGTDASHAWISVYCGESGWVDLDPTNNSVVDRDHVTIAYGRDYSDVCPIQGVIVGGGEHRVMVEVDVLPQPD